MLSVERVRLAYNNVYLVSDGSALVVIDTGPDYRGARETLTAALRGRKADVAVATHGHLDHAGLGRWWQAQGVPVVLGLDDCPQTEGHTDKDIDRMEEYVRGIGAPLAVEAEVIAGLEQRREWALRMRGNSDWPAARDGRWPTALRYETFTPKLLAGEGYALPIPGLRVIHCPGHTPGNLVVVDESDGEAVVIFSGDQLLPEITPTPAIQFHAGRRFASLPRFLDSLRELARRYPRTAVCYPGHGEPFEDVAEVITANLAQAEQRSVRLLEELRAGGPATVYELAERSYPRALRRRFWQIIATVQGQLDALGESGRAIEADGRWTAR